MLQGRLLSKACSLDRDYSERLASVFDKMDKKFVPRLKKHISPDLLEAHPGSRAEPAESSMRTEPADSAKPAVSAKRARPADLAESAKSAPVANQGWPFDVPSRPAGPAEQDSSQAAGAEASASGQQAGQGAADKPFSAAAGCCIAKVSLESAAVPVCLMQPPALPSSSQRYMSAVCCIIAAEAV